MAETHQNEPLNQQSKPVSLKAILRNNDLTFADEPPVEDEVQDTRNYTAD